MRFLKNYLIAMLFISAVALALIAFSWFFVFILETFSGWVVLGVTLFLTMNGAALIYADEKEKE